MPGLPEVFWQQTAGPCPRLRSTRMRLARPDVGLPALLSSVGALPPDWGVSGLSSASSVFLRGSAPPSRHRSAALLPRPAQALFFSKGKAKPVSPLGSWRALSAT